MILSRLFLNPSSRAVQQAIADGHALHTRVMSMWPSDAGPTPRAQLGVLHRLEIAERAGIVSLIVQSVTPPDFSRLPPGFVDARAGGDAATSKNIDSLVDALVEGARLRFRLRANPTRKIDTKSAPNGDRRNGRRVPVREEAGRVAWIQRRLTTHGFRLLECEVRPEGKQLSRVGSQLRTHEAFVFDGSVEVVERGVARAALASGIGPAKAYGFGLLSLAGPA